MISHGALALSCLWIGHQQGYLERTGQSKPVDARTEKAVEESDGPLDNLTPAQVVRVVNNAFQSSEGQLSKNVLVHAVGLNVLGSRPSLAHYVDGELTTIGDERVFILKYKEYTHHGAKAKSHQETDFQES